MSHNPLPLLSSYNNRFVCQHEYPAFFESQLQIPTALTQLIPRKNMPIIDSTNPCGICRFRLPSGRNLCAAERKLFIAPHRNKIGNPAIVTEPWSQDKIKDRTHIINRITLRILIVLSNLRGLPMLLSILDFTLRILPYSLPGT